MQIYSSGSERETERLGGQLAKTLRAGDVVAFRGGLGAGKTAFTRGLAAGLGAVDTACSPTFSIANVYRGGRLRLVHFDMYRIADMASLEGAGYYDYIAEGNTVYAVEWSENIAEALPAGSIIVSIEPVNDTTRRITIEGGRA